ncbi:hypothetical protein PPTG_21674 [Phytophthora nicotianae INRA-310]|uniref:HTH CENPB-type domain-containing protein n=1 Tax=Phytophthora nicotianae (strain INRA-310) TaxID=761204 RepID=W2QX16_PHYN3|nr:hypothetical protein PPTG_21674 [Phytophthora nicotianae INRA-310]ETN17678.1 hypothetical protein PPTG_21674 [Phytophthora nicotianae INRA-310]
MVKSKHRNYTIKEKLDILSQHVKGVKGKGFFALGKKHQIASGTIRGWLGDGGSPAKHGDVERRLHEWILDRNAMGLRVKDAYIRLQAVNIYRDLHGPQASGFDASTGWLARFKRRKNLVSRRQTTTQILPDNSGEICRNFIQRVQQLIHLHNIKLDKIINMDQVPRYFKTEPKTTITTRGSPSRRVDDIKKAFTLCGVEPKTSFNRDKLHQPLKDLLASDLDMEKWHASYQHIRGEADDREQLCVAAPSLYLPDNERSSLFYCLLFGVSIAVDDFVYELVSYMKNLEDLSGLIDELYLDELQQGNTDPGELEIHAASKLHSWNVVVTAVDKDCKVGSKFTY